MSTLLTSALALALALALARVQAPDDPSAELDALKRAADAIAVEAPAVGNLAKWRARLLPTEAEARWAEIPWLDSFAAGVRTANEERKPVLFWAMNGHPLGCT